MMKRFGYHTDVRSNKKNKKIFFTILSYKIKDKVKIFQYLTLFTYIEKVYIINLDIKKQLKF